MLLTTKQHAHNFDHLHSFVGGEEGAQKDALVYKAKGSAQLAVAMATESGHPHPMPPPWAHLWNSPVGLSSKKGRWPGCVGVGSSPLAPDILVPPASGRGELPHRTAPGKGIGFTFPLGTKIGLGRLSTRQNWLKPFQSQRCCGFRWFWSWWA